MKKNVRNNSSHEKKPMPTEVYTEEEMAAVNALPQRPYYQVPDEPPAFVTTVMDYSRQA